MKKIPATFFKFHQYDLPGSVMVIFTQNHLVCHEVMIIQVKEFHFCIFKSKTRNELSKDFSESLQNTVTQPL